MFDSRLHRQDRFIEFRREETEQSVPHRFENQVARYPNQLAVKTSLDQLTYADFNKVANRLARAIRQRSRGSAPVALLLEHDLFAVVAIFGVLKAGTGFIPLDPSLPASRLEYMLKDSGAELIVTNNKCLTLAEQLLGGRSLVDIDRIDPALEIDNLGISISPDSLSCILYTSGTTGRPKGVMHTHRNELHNIMHHTNSLCLSADDRITLLGSYSTGQGMQDLYCALLNGGTLYPWNLKADGLTGLAEWLSSEQITVYHSAATVFRHFVRNLSGGDNFPQLRVVRLGSERVSWKDVEAYKRHFSRDCVFINALSSSETKTIRQYVANKQTQVTGMVPVGYPVPDMEILILDDSGKQLGPNQSGEIAVRSRYLSPGYWQRADLTGAAFLLDPSCSENRIFRTGEWGRMSPDGCLEHLGRRDAQVKIRGYRIEIYEIELALLMHPAVDQVVVLCRDNINGDRYLAAYIVLNQSTVPTVSQLRSFLRARLPEYMIPSAFIVLDSLPLAPNGKVDRSALPEPTAARPMLDVPYVSPSTPAEESLAKIWAEILGIEEIGVHDNFFDLGGNSLSAMRLVARVENAYCVKVPLRTFFDSPNIASLNENISTSVENVKPRERLSVKPAKRNDPVPLSFAQQRLWFLDQWEPNSPLYNICRASYLTGPLDLDAMEESLNRIVERHEILRTTFPSLDGEPMQVVAPVIRLTPSIIDLQGLPETERRKQSLLLANDEARRPFNLAHGPLLRVSFARLADEEHLFVFTAHQIVCDGWSVQIFLRELWTFYDSLSVKGVPALPALSVQYADFTLWQRQWLESKILDPQLSYWKKKLWNSLSILNLPTDRSRPGSQSFRGARQPLVLPKSLSEDLKDLSRRAGVTVFMTLMAAFKTLLYRYTGQEDLIVGFPIAGRNWPDTAGLIGFFVNTMIARTDLTGKPTFRELLARVRDVCIGAYAHQDLPFAKLVEELQPKRELNRNPLFQVMFVFQISPSPRECRAIRSQPVELDGGISKFDLMLSLTDVGTELRGFFEYSTDLFDRSTIERMAGHLQTLLNSILADSDQRICDLPILAETERRQLLIEWNDTKKYFPGQKCIHELFEAQVERTPDAIAIDFDGKQLTYRELNRRANQLAHYLRGRGIGPEKLVGICVERSLEMVVGLVGILKAGGAYLPLDARYPRERLTFMLHDAQPTVLLTQAKLVEDRGWRMEDGDPLYPILDPRLQVVCLDRDWPIIEQESAENAQAATSPDDLAYVIYTSGSTGIPKGIAIEHRNSVALLHWASNVFTPAETAGLLATTSICFDLSVFELFVPLSCGGKIILAENALHMTSLAAKNEVTLINTVPSAMAELMATGKLPDSVRTVNLAGEPLSSGLVRQIYESSGVEKVYDLYGPSETTTYSTLALRSADGPAIIGRPIANTEIYVLNNYQPVPVGVPGEVYIGGAGVARGYWNHPELTAERFIANPFTDEPGSRLYRTGDLARYFANGNLEFLGRVDNQVKIRGHRVELGEIEAVLNRHPAVRESVVVARDDATQGAGNSENPKSKTCTELSRSIENRKAARWLVAYIVADAQQPAANELRDFLKEKLPEYMLPSIFVPIATLPVTANGKVDRAALPSPDGARPRFRQALVEPRTEIEGLVAQIWREVLKVEKIGVYDNFFELGGHSLSAVRIVSRLRNAFAVELSLPKIFEQPTVTDLARAIEKSLQEHQNAKIAPIIAVERKGPILPSIAQEPILMLERLVPGIPQFNIAVSYRLAGPLDVVALERSVNEVIQRHEALRTIFPIIEGQQIQFVLPSLPTSLAVVDLQGSPQLDRESKYREIAKDEAQMPFDLRRGPLFRVRLLRLSDDNHILLLTLHHVISDGWSLVLFLRDLAAFYSCCLAGSPSSLPELPIQYVDFTQWQQRALREDSMDSQLAYWEHQLSGPLLPLQFARGFARSDELGLFTARKPLSIAGELFQSLIRRSRQENSTPFMILASALNILMHHLTRQQDIRIGTLVANRNRIESENVIGHFVNTVVLRTNLSSDLTCRDVVNQVRDITLAAHVHQDLPFEALVRYLESERKLPRSSICQVMFIYQPAPFHAFNPAGLKVTSLEENRGNGAPEMMVTAFDLIFLLKEKPGELAGHIIYKLNAFDEAAIDQIVSSFRDVLERITTNPDLSVAAIGARG